MCVILQIGKTGISMGGVVKLSIMKWVLLPSF